MQGRKRVELVVDSDGAKGDPIGVIYADGTIESRAIQQSRKRRARRSPVSFVMIEESAATLAPSSITPTQTRILNYLLARYQEEEQMTVVRQTNMIHDLRMDKSNFRRALKDLIDRKFLFRLGPNAWMVSPHYGFRGRTTIWRQLLDRYPEPEWVVPTEHIQ